MGIAGWHVQWDGTKDSVQFGGVDTGWRAIDLNQMRKKVVELFSISDDGKNFHFRSANRTYERVNRTSRRQRFSNLPQMMRFGSTLPWKRGNRLRPPVVT